MLVLESIFLAPRYFLWVNTMSHEAIVSLCLCGDQRATGYHKDTKKTLCLISLCDPTHTIKRRAIFLQISPRPCSRVRSRARTRACLCSRTPASATAGTAVDPSARSVTGKALSQGCEKLYLFDADNHHNVCRVHQSGYGCSNLRDH
jgi:hypothetical protein